MIHKLKGNKMFKVEYVYNDVDQVYELVIQRNGAHKLGIQLSENEARVIFNVLSQHFFKDKGVKIVIKNTDEKVEAC